MGSLRCLHFPCQTPITMNLMQCMAKQGTHAATISLGVVQHILRELHRRCRLAFCLSFCPPAGAVFAGLLCSIWGAANCMITAEAQPLNNPISTFAALLCSFKCTSDSQRTCTHTQANLVHIALLAWHLQSFHSHADRPTLNTGLYSRAVCSRGMLELMLAALLPGTCNSIPKIKGFGTRSCACLPKTCLQRLCIWKIVVSWKT